MKKEDEIFRKMKNEKPLVKTAADAPPARTGPRKIGETAELQSRPVRRASAPTEPQMSPQEIEEPRRRARESRRPIAAAQPPAERPVRRQIAVPALDAGEVLTDKVGGDPRTFEKPHKVTKPTTERRPLTYRHEKKFFISYGDYLILRQQLKALMHTDEHADANGQ